MASNTSYEMPCFTITKYPYSTMRQRACSPPLHRAFLLLAVVGAAAGCGTDGLPGTDDVAADAGGSGSAAGGQVGGVGGLGTVVDGGGGGSSVVGAGGAIGDPSRDCKGGETVSAKRIVRLSFNQIANSLATLVDATLGTEIVEGFELVDAEHRAFPPLQSPREGNSYTDQSWNSADQIAQAAGQYVFDNLDPVTGCSAEPSDDCALSYLTELAKKAYRRPLAPEELDRLTTLYTTEFKGAGASVAEATQYGVYAIFQAPQFLYRTEFGADALAGGSLTQLELAAMLSFFLTDDTPDQLLADAAEAGELATPEQVGAQVDRILETDAARENLHGAMMSYFSYPNLETQIIQDDAFTGEMRASMYREAELFLDRALWSEPLDALLNSTTSYVNETLAPIYGIDAFPPSGVAPLEESFYEVELPAGRTGLLTQAGFLANRSRPDETSVVGRGLLIKNAFLCTETPAPSEAIFEAIEMLEEANPNASAREMAELREQNIVCGNCHASIDPYGLALDTFDVIGRYREVDAEGRPIDPSVVLPKEIGGGEAQDIVEVAHQLVASGAFSKCMGQNLINYALADVSAGAANIESCAVADVTEAFEVTDGSFSSLIRAVAMSAAFSTRTQGDNQ